MKIVAVIWMMLILGTWCCAQEKPIFRAMFYNTENLYDTKDDSTTNDDEFTAVGQRHWTSKRFQTKINNLYKVILSAAIQPPDIIGLCEVENDYVLNRLTQNTPLEKFDYKFVHYDSPDPRGIDVALLYKSSTFQVLQSHPIFIFFPFDESRKTRDILYVVGLANKKDTFHVFINHWPSRRGGQEKSEPYRIRTAQVLKQKTDSLLAVNNKAKILIMGDFNDEPDDVSLSKTLDAAICSDDSKCLINLSGCLLSDKNIAGTHKFNGQWAILDQAIISKSFIGTATGYKIGKGSLQIVNSVFLLKPDVKESGQTMQRTYSGFRYTAGYSDHLPIVVTFDFVDGK